MANPSVESNPREPTVSAAAWQELAAALDGELLTDLARRRLYATDASPYETLPAAVARPRTAADCARLVDFCREQGLALTARGGGTGLAGQCLGTGLVVDCSRHLDEISGFEPEQGRVRVEPGVVPERLNRMLQAHGLMFGPDPSTLNRCNIGGMFGNNAWGAHAPRDGTTRDNVVAVEALLSDASAVRFQELDDAGLQKLLREDSLQGRIYRGLDQLLRRHGDAIRAAYPEPGAVCNNTGYPLHELLARQPWNPDGPGCNLTPLLCGSEGTLALATSLTLRLRQRPPARTLVCAHFESVDAALRALPELLRLQPAALELLDEKVLELTRHNPAQARNRFWVQGRPQAVLMIEFSGAAVATAAAAAETGRMLRRGHGCYACVEVQADSIDRVWALRRAGLGLLMGLPGRRQAVSGLEDSAVPPAALADYVATLKSRFDSHGIESVWYGSVSMGLVHVRPLLDLDDPGDRDLFRRMLEFEADLAREYGGCITTKHGDGRLRAHCLERQYGPAVAGLLGEVKRLFDPEHLFNPGKIVDPAPLLEDLRRRPRPPAPLLPGLLWPAPVGTDGFLAAAAQCQGAGACRKRDDGAMCPSFRASGEEALSTRGRANLLRQAVLDGAAAFADPVLADALDQCLACKSCRSECPANVDMARLKTEYLHQQLRGRRPPLERLAAAEFARISALGSRLPGLANRLASSRSLRAWLGISEHRMLPRLARRRFSSLWPQQQRPAAPGAPPVILLLDAYTEFYEPWIGIAAARVLQACGLDPRPTACLPAGRTAYSQGVLGRAAAQVESVLDCLAGFDPATPVLGLEPSEVLCLRGDAATLPLPDARRGDLGRLAERLYLFDELLLGEPYRDRLQALLDRLDPHPAEYRVHVHCHQRALATADTSVELLGRIPGTRARLFSATCCGMAGDFGYRARNYELSVRVGELSLFPQVRDLADSTPVVANGHSCRHQIAHGTARTAQHLAEVLAVRLGLGSNPG